jgi:imidazolonepropionase-like amidohydrolase
MKSSDLASTVCAAALVCSAVASAQTSEPIAITHANVIDGTSATVQRNVTILVRGRTIERIGAGIAVPNGAREIDVAGRYVVPGLIDAHTHLASLDNAKRALESGVTTVRSASTPHYEDVAIRELAKAGVIPGPDVVASGVFVRPQLGETILADPRLGAWSSGVQSLDALRGVVRVNLDHGVDVIKTMSTERAGLPNTDPRKQLYTEEQLRAVVDEAKTKNIPVMVHAHGDEGAYAAVAAGARSIEHGTYLSDSTLRLMKQKGTFFVPTLSTVVDLTEPGGDYDDPVLMIRGAHMLPRIKDAIRRAHAMGVPIVTGGDTGYGPQSLTRISHEVMRFVELGFTPFEALQSATTVAADLLGISNKTGKLVAGYEADLIVVEGNPLDNIVALQDVLVVVSNGQVALNRLPFTRLR